jgi:hypothetical protein
VKTALDTRWLFPETRAIAEAELAAENARSFAPYAPGHIYVVEFTSGVVKVGKSTEPEKRISAHSKFAEIHGGSIRTAWISRELVGFNGAERELIKLCSQISAPVFGREYFDIPYRAAWLNASLVEANRMAVADVPDELKYLFAAPAPTS